MRLLAIAALSCLPVFGAANMVATSLSINANGAWSVTFSPCSTPLSPGSGVTGITLTNSVDANAASVQAATTSGCTLTVTTYAVGVHFPIAADDTQSALSNVTFTIAAASNLTDNAGNTVSASGNTSLAPSANNSTYYAAGGTLFPNYWRLDASPALGNQNGIKDAEWASPDGCARASVTWSGSNGQVSFNAFDYNAKWAMFEDGVQVGGFFGAATVTYTTYTPSTTLTGTHTYEVCNVHQPSGNYVWLNAISIQNGSYNALPAVKKWFYVFGASEVACQGLTDTTQCVWWIMARNLGMSDQHVGVAGWPVTANTFGGTSYPTSNLSACAAGSLAGCPSLFFTFTTKPAFVLVVPGGNDAIDGTLAGPNYTTAGYFKGDAVTELSSLVSRVAPTGNRLLVTDEYYAPGIPGTPCPAGSNQYPYENNWIGAGNYYAGQNPTYPVTAFSTFAATCGFGGGDFQGDNLHLNATGQAAWAAVLQPFLNGFVANQSVIVIQ